MTPINDTAKRIEEICKQLERHAKIEKDLKREIRELMLKLKLKL